MNRGNNYTVQQVLQRLQTDQLDDSCDEDEETELQDNKFVSTCCTGVESCDSDSDSGEDEQSSAAVSVDFLSESDQSVSQYTAEQVNARNGAVWKNITSAPGLGRASLFFVLFLFYLPFLSSIHEKANCIAILWTGSPHSIGSCLFRGLWATCLPHKDKGIPLSALPKDTTSELAGLFSTTSHKCRAPSRETVNTLF